MVTKSIVVFWSVLCFMLFMKELGSGMMFVILLMWGVVVVPTAAVGTLFKKNWEPTPSQNMVRVGVLAAVAVAAFAFSQSAFPNRDKSLTAQQRLEQSQERLEQAKQRLDNAWDRARGR